MVVKLKKTSILLLLLLLVIVGVFGVKYGMEQFYKAAYPQEYSALVTQYAQEFSVDENLIYAIIKTESDFQPDATSNVGARGLMQIMEDTFDWITTKLPKSKKSTEDKTTYDDMYTPAHNIRYGAFLIGYLHKEFGDVETAIAAYHAGRTATAKWLKDAAHSSDGVTLDSIPIKDTRHYVSKVMKSYQIYQKMYG